MNKKLLLMAAAGLALCGCSKQGAPLGSPVRFAVSAATDGTRTVFSGEGTADGAGALAVERIDWVDQDKIRICSDQAVTSLGLSHGDYSVVSHETASASVSRAVIAGDDGFSQELHWSSTNAGPVSFCALYPAPKSIPSADRSKVSIDMGQMKGVVPANQTVTAAAAGTYVADMRYAFMLAVTRDVDPRDYAVNLSFVPEFTAFEFTIACGDNDRVDLTSFKLESAADAVSGQFTVPTASGTDESTFAFSGTALSVQVDFTALPEGKLTLNRGESTVFTVLALPHTMTGLRISFTGDQMGTRSMNLSQGGSSLTFAGRKKHRIYGLSFPNVLTAQGEDILWDQETFGEGIDWDERLIVM